MITRLQCFHCDRDDWDSMIPGPHETVLLMNPTASEMREAATRAGWQDIYRMLPPGPEDANWATHTGECPDCIEAANTEPAG